MKIEELTIGEAREIASMFSSKLSAQTHSFTIGKSVIIRTVTHYFTGRIVSVTDSDLVLEDAAWIPDTGRWSTILASGIVNEAEPYLDPVIVSRGAITDTTLWRHPLPKTQK